MMRLPLCTALFLSALFTSAAEDIGQEAEAQVARLLAAMTLEQKVAQMIQPEIRWLSVEDVRRYGFGSVLNGGGSFPGMNKRAGLQDWLDLADELHAASIDRSMGNAGIPIIWGTDAVHGHATVYGATVFPHNIGLGATRNPDLVAAVAAATARETRATGLDWIFAPTVAVATDLRWGRTYESFGTDPDWVGRLSAATVRGIQSQGVAATAKHFIGDGGTWRGVDQGDTRVSHSVLRDHHGAGYTAAIEAQVMTVMASFNSWNGKKVHGHKGLLNGMLRQEMGFTGVVVSDWNGIGQVRYCSNDDCPQAINAGVDVLMAPRDWEALLHNTVAQVRRGEIAPARIDEAVARILRLKQRLGVLDGDTPSQRATDASQLGHASHRQLAAQAVRESLVLLKNEGGVLPLRAGQRILVSGSAANDIGRQSGGWTLTWQGTENENSDFPGGSSIFEGIARHAAAHGGMAWLSEDGSFQAPPDLAVVAFGEIPYAEGVGDVPHLAHRKRYPDDLEILHRLREASVPVVAVFVTGRPAWTNPELNASDAFVVAWLPGSEGAAVADVLFAPAGSAHEFVGVLPMPWPGNDLNVKDPDLPVASSLFPVGYGLSVAQHSEVEVLSEASQVRDQPPEEVLFHRRSQPPWVVVIDEEWREDRRGRENANEGAEQGAESELRLRGPLLETPSGGLSVAVVDYQLQADAIRSRWRGDGDRVARLGWQHAGGASINLDDKLGAHAVLALSMIVHERPEHGVHVGVECGASCNGFLNIEPSLSTAAAGEVTRLLIPLSCLLENGADFTRVSAPLLIKTAGAFDMTLIDARYRMPRDGEGALSCQPLSEVSAINVEIGNAAQ